MIDKTSRVPFHHNLEKTKYNAALARETTSGASKSLESLKK